MFSVTLHPETVSHQPGGLLPTWQRTRWNSSSSTLISSQETSGQSTKDLLRVLSQAPPPQTLPPTTLPGLTCLYAAGFSAQVGQVDVGLPPVDDGVWVLAGSLGRPSVRHGDLTTQRVQPFHPPRKTSASGCFLFFCRLFNQNPLQTGFALS